MNQQYTPLPPSGPRTSTTAIISLIGGIAGVVQILPVIGPIAAIITGHMAKKEIKNSGGMVTGNGMATAGLVMGYIMVGLYACGCIAVAVMFALGMTIPFIGNTTSY
jgi:hypothetical protein